MSAPVIVVDDVTKSYGGTKAVDGLSFEVSGGKVTGFLGPNGAGKTTTIQVTLGLARPDSGQATLWGEPYRRLERPATRVGTLIEGAGFHPSRTARDHIGQLAVAGGIASDRIDTVLRTVELADAADKRVGGFSLGMRQRLGLASALLGDPELLLLDEPANGLDPAGMRWLREFLRGFVAKGRTVFVSSHVLSELALVADEVVVINRGRFVAHRPVAELTTGTSALVRSADPERLRLALSGNGVTVQLLDEDVLEVVGMPTERIGEIALLEQVALFELTPRAHSLEDVFLELTSSKGENDDTAA